MKLTFVFTVSIVLVLCHCQKADSFNENEEDPGYFRRFVGQFRSPPTTHAVSNYGHSPDYGQFGSYYYPYGLPKIEPEPLPYYLLPDHHPYGYNPSYGSSYEFPHARMAASAPGSPNLPALATDDEIVQLSEALFAKETNSQLGKITINIQGKTRAVDIGDEAPEPLLQVDEKALQSPTIAKMRDLFDNYHMDTSIEEVVTAIEEKEQDDFVDAVIATNVMRLAMQFLQKKGIVSADIGAQRQLLKLIWFTLYSRGQGKLGSSGFEHVFVNEVKNGNIIGLHNWVYFNEEEKAGRLDYKGYMKTVDLGIKGAIIKARFTHNGLNKPVNSLFIGTSPELEMALYTVCFELRANEQCPLSLGGKKFSIQTYSWRYMGKDLIGSAYPII